MTYYNISSTKGIWLMYLRKSRQDDPNETVAEVLAKHEAMLQEYAKRELGAEIPEENIYREVVSGESIDDRVEIKKVLARIEDPGVAGVLVIEPQRLSRGDLEDCGRLINSFRFTHTQVATLTMAYDLENKMERKFFQDELLRGRDFLEYTKEILLRGRIAAVKRGCFIGNTAPYGYNKITIGKDHTLEPNENADVVRLAFELYVKEGLTPYRIACRLNEMGIPSPRGGEWQKDTIRTMLRNHHYAGYVVFNKIKSTPVLENGEIIVKKLRQSDEDMLIAEGKHEAIISRELWEESQILVARNPRHKHTHELKNPYSGLLRCAKCGKAIFHHPYKHAEDRLECRTRPRCYKSVRQSDMTAAILFALETIELPALELKVKNGDGNALKIRQQLLAKLEKQMEEFRAQEDKQFDLLETGVYSQEVFDRRNGVLRDKMEKCRQEIYQTKATMPKSVDYAEQVVKLQDAIAVIKDPDATPVQKNKILKAIIDRIEFTGYVSDPENKIRLRHGHNPFTLEVFLRL